MASLVTNFNIDQNVDNSFCTKKNKNKTNIFEKIYTNMVQNNLLTKTMICILVDASD